VRSGHETSTHYFSCSSGPTADFIKSVPGHVTLNMCFPLWVDLLVVLCIPVRPGVKCRHTIFVARVGTIRIPKKRDGTHYVKLEFLPWVGYVGHVVHSGASGQ
jgi:hypothetical protein